MKTIIKSIMITCAVSISALSLADSNVEKKGVETLENQSVTETQKIEAQKIKTQPVTSEEMLLQAQKTLSDAEALADSIIAQAQRDADGIRAANETTLVATSDIAPELKAIKMQDEVIAIELHNRSIADVIKAILPDHWRLLLDANDDIKNQKIDLVAQKTRDEILQDLALTLNLQYQYFDQIKDEQGQPSPLFVIRQAP